MALALESIRALITSATASAAYYPAINVLHLVAWLASAALALIAWKRLRFPYSAWMIVAVAAALPLWRSSGRYAVVIFPLFVGLALMLTTSTEKDIAINYRWGEQAFFNADAALEYGKNVLASYALLNADFATILPLPRADATVPVDATPASYWIEDWRAEAVDAGTRMLDRLRNGVEAALDALGT